MGNRSRTRSAEPPKTEDSLNKQREIHKELSVTIRRTMFMMLAYSASCGVIIAQPDVPFVLLSSGVQLPVIDVAVSLKAFLLVGPIGLIAITTYLHLFLAKLNRITGLDEYDKQPFLFNFQDWFSRLLGSLIFYATPSIVMLGFSWKSAVTNWPVPMHLATVGVTAGISLLYLKRRLRPRQFTPIMIGVIVLLGIASVCTLVGLIGYSRTLNLERAQLPGGYLVSVVLGKANLRFANLENANLRRAWLNQADLSRANLSGANLEGATLDYAFLREASIDETTRLDKKWKLVWELVNVGGENRDLSGADLSEANLRGTNLSGANLSEADLRGTMLMGAILTEADLRRANLDGAKGLTIEQIKEAIIDQETKLPKDLKEAVDKQKEPEGTSKP